MNYFTTPSGLTAHIVDESKRGVNSYCGQFEVAQYMSVQTRGYPVCGSCQRLRRVNVKRFAKFTAIKHAAMRLASITFILLTASIAHGQDRQCPLDDTLCVAEVAAARLSAANAKITALTQINTDYKAIIDAKDQLIGVKDQIIANLQKIDTNSQKIDTLGQETSAIWREQHNEDKLVIVDLQKDLASCRGNQKWIFSAGALAGGAIGYKIRSSGVIQNPFQSNFQSAEERARQAMKAFTK